MSFGSAEQKEDKKHVEMEESGGQNVLIGNLKKRKSCFIVLSETLAGITVDTLPFYILWSKFYMWIPKLSSISPNLVLKDLFRV